ncbi:zinc finger MYM-type protein 1-like [Metopolophium dirhodum]|uniref:zinc finger MYM-type protein 1-like n=1 Tax=Metopolophium dirhodum TaxID=44670 RepID=UPI00298F4F60|nr:zinc finger MYM-type protein 1-like [Metopolophium dirhodum]
MYTSPLIQNEIINLFGDLIQSKILERVSKTNFYTILADETTDISQIEQFSLCIRYVDEQVFSIREDFLTFVPVYDISGEGLANTIKETLKKIGFDLNKMRGQGYDGAAAMRGRFRGVQAIIKDMYPKVLYTHCVSHSLNLCLSDATKSQDIRNAFGVIILKNKIKEIKPNSQSTKLKSLCETRWVLRHEAVMLFKEFVEPVVAALEKVQSECSGTDSSKRAKILIYLMLLIKFLV